MNNIQHQLAVKEAVKGKFKGKTELKGRTKPQYPVSAEREYKRLMNSYIKIFRDTLKAHLPKIMEYCKQQRADGTRYDDDFIFSNNVSNEFREISKELEQELAKFGVEEFLQKIGSISQNVSLREWKRCVKNTLGIDLLSDYYKGDFYAEQLRRWVEDNTKYIKSIPQDNLSDMQELIVEKYKEGASITTIQREIQEKFNTTKSKAYALATDQLGTLSAELAKQQQKDAGVSKYYWSTSKDGRVRDCHAELDGEIISWDDPPEMWYETVKSGIVYTGRRCHPGEDYGCRCVAIPCFDIDTLNIPMSEED